MALKEKVADTYSVPLGLLAPLDLFLLLTPCWPGRTASSMAQGCEDTKDRICEPRRRTSEGAVLQYFSLKRQPLSGQGSSSYSLSSQALVLYGATGVDEDRKHDRTLDKNSGTQPREPLTQVYLTSTEHKTSHRCTHAHIPVYMHIRTHMHTYTHIYYRYTQKHI